MKPSHIPENDMRPLPNMELPGCEVLVRDYEVKQPVVAGELASGSRVPLRSLDPSKGLIEGHFVLM